jgi:hypothetical protein
MFQQREEREVLLAVDNDSVSVGQQPVRRRPRSPIQLLVTLTRQVDLQRVVRQAHEHRLAHDQVPSRRVESCQIPKAFDLPMTFLDVGA